MNRLLLLGPKRLLSQVVDELQRLGAVHIDRIETEPGARVSAMRLSEEDSRAVQTLERGVTRVDGILTLLPAATDTVPIDPAEYAPLAVEDLDAQIGALEGRVRELTRTRLELEEERDLIGTYEGALRVLSPLLSALAGSKTLQTVGFLISGKAPAAAVIALREELNKATDGRVEVVSAPVDDKGTGVVVAFRHQDADAVRAVLTRAGVSELRLPTRFTQPHHADTVALMKRRTAEIPAELARIDPELAAVAARERPRLAAMRSALADRLAQMKIVPEFAESRYTFIIHGWAPARDVDRIRARLREQFGDDVLVQATPIDAHHDDSSRVPVLLDNHPLIRPIQRLLALFQPPRYDAWDPSPVMAVTFPIFVGLVIGDVGYGLLLFLLGWWLRGRARAGQALSVNFLSLRFTPSLLADISYLIRLAAFWIIVFGAIYAEFFGNLPELLFGTHPIFDRVHNTDAYFTVIVATGILMIFGGLAIHLVEAVRHRHAVGVFESLVIMMGTAGLLLFLGARGDRLPAALGPVGLYLFGGAVVVAAVSLIVDRNAMQRVLWLLESTASFGHILSYARLMAFGLAAAALATAANQLGQQAGGISIVLAIAVGAVFQILFFTFTILGHVIQPARLHWVEFFTKFKFHEHTGQRYAPFQKAGSDV
ncbi:MAG TPA: V-type ATPase 116kDa subunit family protein [bacterium]